MKTYTITSAQMTEVLAALAHGHNCLSNKGRGEVLLLSRDETIKKLAKAHKDLALIEFQG